MEKLMQYVWQHRLWTATDLRTVDGDPVEVIDQGLLNTDAGPDFFNAKVRIGGHEWAGNVEIHVRASDWHRHGHDSDPAYDSVVLHVVGVDDGRITRSNGEVIPQLVMPTTQQMHDRYSAMLASPDLPACREVFGEMSALHLADWFSSLTMERLQQKADRIYATLARVDGDWVSAAYVTVARAMGFGINSDAMERMALATPLKPMMKHRSSAHQVEALLFGQSGLLPPEGTDEYADTLRREHAHLCRKFEIKPAGPIAWRMARTRPQNFPHRRIAALAAMIAGGFCVSSGIYEVRTAAEARDLFNVELCGYWASRYSFSPAGTGMNRVMSDSAIDILIINAVAPLLYARGAAFGDVGCTEAAVSILQSIKPENNSVVRLFAEAGLKCTDAFASQALIQLRRMYCEQRKCLYCRLGHRYLARR